MRITRIHIENFRSIRNLKMDLGDATVLIGQNNAGKTAILDAVRIVLTRRWGQRGIGFTENDVHRSHPDGDPRTLPPIKIMLVMEESETGEWDQDMVDLLQDIISFHDDDRSILTVQVTCAWSEEKEAFDPDWQFLDVAGEPFSEQPLAVNLAEFFSYMPLFWLGPLRDASTEFTPRAGHWGRLLRSIRIPDELEKEAMEILANLDDRIEAAAPNLSEIAAKISQSTRVAIGEGLGEARLKTLPSRIEEMLQGTGVVLRNEEQRPWLPIGQHGQGLQSLAVIFLFQAAVSQQLAESDKPGVEPVFAIEEPEAHLHPQAARTLWESVQKLSGQKIMATHSPYFVQHVPLRDIRMIRLQNGCTEFSALPQHIVSELPWNDRVDRFVAGQGSQIFCKDNLTGRVAAQSWFNDRNADLLLRCFRQDPDYHERTEAVRHFRHNCRILPTTKDEEALGFHGRRVRGEIFFARRWFLVEGVTEYLLVHALGKALEWPLDAHGVAVIDFKQSGNAGIYPALAEAFGIPWHMIVDGDHESEKFKREILKRGFSEGDLDRHFETLDQPNSLEDQIISDGHEQLLREILAEFSSDAALDCPYDEFVERLKDAKSGYMGTLAMRVAEDQALAEQMPAPFVELIKNLKDGSV